MNQVLKVIDDRCSLRRFSPRPIEDEVLNEILDAAIRAPTATNRMLYSIIVVRDQARRDILAQRCNNQAFIKTAPLILIFVADQQKHYDFYAAGGVQDFVEKRGKAFMKPAEHHFLLGVHDALSAAENAVIAAESLGVGSCYIGHIVSHYELNRKLFKLPPLAFPITMLVMGYPAEDAVKVRQPRFGKKYVVFDEEYHRLDSDEIADMYSRFSCPPNNRFDAANSAQYYYMRRYDEDQCYWESVRSVREALKNWKG